MPRLVTVLKWLVEKLEGRETRRAKKAMSDRATAGAVAAATASSRERRGVETPMGMRAPFLPQGMAAEEREQRRGRCGGGCTCGVR